MMHDFAWQSKGKRLYYASVGTNIQAFVFGTAEPMQLWAWYVVWSLNGHDGSQANVAHSYRAAIARATECIREVDAAMPQAR